MEDLVWYLTYALSLVTTFCFIWLFLVMSASIEKNQKTTEENKTPFVSKGKKLTQICMAIGTVSIAYMLYTGRVDTFAYASISASLVFAICALWRCTNSIGSYAFTSHIEWRKVKNKSYIQALGITIFLVILQQIDIL